MAIKSWLKVAPRQQNAINVSHVGAGAGVVDVPDPEDVRDVFPVGDGRKKEEAAVTKTEKDKYRQKTR